MRRHEFELLVAHSLESLPESFKAYLDNVVVIVEDLPSGQLLDNLGMGADETLMGYYEGTPLTQYGREYDMRLPDRILIFKDPIEEVCQNRDEVEEEVRKTVMHEIGHFFGLGEDELEHL